MSKPSIKPASTRDIYRQSRDRVNALLKILVQVKQETTHAAVFEKEFDTLLNTARLIYVSQKMEAENDYRKAMVNVSNWVLNAIHRDYIKQNSSRTPSAPYAIKKGLEVLHLLLHRDLRRRVLSATESQLYFEFERLATSLPPPPRDNSKSSEQPAADVRLA